MQIELMDMRTSDYHYVKSVYDHYILNSTATFHTKPLTIEELQEQIPVGHPLYGAYLIRYQGRLCGFCYFAPYKKRQAYDRSAEITIYLEADFMGQGIGKHVLEQTETIAKNRGIKVLLGIITGNNETSIRLFRTCGYEQCAHFKQVGEKFGQVLDVVAFQKILNSSK